MSRVTTVIIGAGQAGLAMSYHLSKQSVDHVLLERGQVGNSWSNERWDSLRLLTPNWQSRLPGYHYIGEDPDDYRTMPETIAFLQRYAELTAPPLQTNTEVTAVLSHQDGYKVVTNQGIWTCKTVVLASGACNIATVPECSKNLSSDIFSITPLEYRNPEQLPDGGVMVVGASASGVQLANELRLTGRHVMLAVGEHVRVPRTYRGRDIKWWMDAAGFLDVGYDEVDDLTRVRNVPSLQLIGCPNRQTISLNSLQAIGVEIVGRLMGLDGSKAQFSGALANVCALADLKMNRLLAGIDEWVAEKGGDRAVGGPYRLRPTIVPDMPTLQCDLARNGIKTIVWATGYRPDYSWLNLPVVSPRGDLRHDGGVVTEVPGVYAMGLPFMRRRKSSLIDGVGDDAQVLSEHLRSFLDTRLAAFG